MILDTPAYTNLARNVGSIVDAVQYASDIKLPLPVIAELRYGFVKGAQKDRNEQTLQRFLAQNDVSIIMPTLMTTEYYAVLQLLCQKRGKALSQNDIWIAALAKEAGDTLITFDNDFTVFSDTFYDKLIILA